VTPLDLLTAWSPNVPGIAVPAVAALLYLLAVLRLRRRGGPWGSWRLVLWLLSCLLAGWTFAGPPWALRAESEWMDGIALGVASALLPLGVALGDPAGLAERLRGRPVPLLRNALARAVMFPGVSSAISAIFLTAALTSAWWQPGRTAPLPWALLLLCAFLAGLLVNLPLLADDLLPAWASPGVRTLIAFLDGLFDAIPGIVVMLTVSEAAGGGLLAVAEAVGIPLIAATLVQWVRADAAETREVDARLDEQELHAVLEGQEPGAGLWWESDPRFQGRYRRDPPG